MLPGGPGWRSKEMSMEEPTVDTVFLYYQDPLQCLQHLLQNPLNSNHLEFIPYRVYESITKQVQQYTEWMSVDVSWGLQVR